MIDDGFVRRVKAISRVENVMKVIGTAEVLVLAKVADRLALGYERYGSLRNKLRSMNWKKERQEEFLDALVYDVIDEMVEEETK